MTTRIGALERDAASSTLRIAELKTSRVNPYCLVKPSTRPARCSQARRARSSVTPTYKVPFDRFVMMYTHPGNPKISLGQACPWMAGTKACPRAARSANPWAGHERKWMPRLHKCFSLDRCCSNYRATPSQVRILPAAGGGGGLEAYFGRLWRFRFFDLLQDLSPQPRDEQLHHLLVGRGQPAGFGGRGSVAGLVLDVFHHVDQHLGRAQIGTRRFVDHLGDDRLALGDRAAASVDRHDDRLVQRIGQQRLQALGAAAAGVAGLPLLEAGVQQRPASSGSQCRSSTTSTSCPISAPRCCRGWRGRGDAGNPERIDTGPVQTTARGWPARGRP